MSPAYIPILFWKEKKEKKKSQGTGKKAAGLAGLC